MNSIAGGTDDLGHIRPHAIKTWPGKRAPIPTPGDRDFPGLGLGLITGNDLRGPVIVTHGPKLGIATFGKNAAIASLYATKTILAKRIGRIEHLLLIIAALTIN
jgi:hypothetical protein